MKPNPHGPATVGTAAAPAAARPVVSTATASIGWQNVLWSSPDGSALVLSDPRGAKDQYGGRSNILGVLANDKFTPIPHGAVNVIQMAW